MQMTSKNIEMAKVGDDGKFHRFTEEEIQDYLDEAEWTIPPVGLDIWITTRCMQA